MNELKAIVAAYETAVRQGQRVALATVVQVEGSSYRRPGARMLVTEDGRITGAISGGCLEGDALKKAQFAILQRKPRLVIYDTTDEDDLQFGVQLGCNGIVSILFEPIEPAAATNPMLLVQRAVAHRSASVLVTVFRTDPGAEQPGTCGYLRAGEAAWFAQDVAFGADGWRVLRDGQTVVRSYPKGQALYQVVPPVTRLVVAGAGNDAQPLVAMAALLGWETVVVDGRPTHATVQRFPGADRVAVVKAAAVPDAVAVDAQTAVVLMTHNYPYDLALLEALLATPCPYIGVLGPKAKLERMLDDLAGRGVAVGGDRRAAIHGPVGLDLGAETAEEIALSITAEIKACFAGRSGRPLKLRAGSIHERVA